MMNNWKFLLFVVILGLHIFGFTATQIETISPVLPEDSLAYRVEIKLADFNRLQVPHIKGNGSSLQQEL